MKSGKHEFQWDNFLFMIRCEVRGRKWANKKSAISNYSCLMIFSWQHMHHINTYTSYSASTSKGVSVFNRSTGIHPIRWPFYVCFTESSELFFLFRLMLFFLLAIDIVWNERTINDHIYIYKLYSDIWKTEKEPYIFLSILFVSFRFILRCPKTVFIFFVRLCIVSVFIVIWIMFRSGFLFLCAAFYIPFRVDFRRLFFKTNIPYEIEVNE